MQFKKKQPFKNFHVLLGKVKCHGAIKDSDICLQELELWGEGQTCKENAQYCDDWAKDMKRCCPETCKLNHTFTEQICIDYGEDIAKVNGTCKYPFVTYADECFKGI